MVGMDLEGGRFFFNAVRGDGDSILFACDDENECSLWVMAMYRATGQSLKPQPPLTQDKNSTISKIQGDADKARKHGMEDFISADPCLFDHANLFRILQNLTLDYRLNDPYASLGWYSPGQLFVLDEYCARYGVRGCYRHLCYLADLLDRAEKHIMIDPTLIHYSFAFCASHVHGNRPDGVGSITHEEKERFQNIKERLRVLLEYQITNFRYAFRMYIQPAVNQIHLRENYRFVFPQFHHIQILLSIWPAGGIVEGNAVPFGACFNERYCYAGATRRGAIHD